MKKYFINKPIDLQILVVIFSVSDLSFLKFLENCGEFVLGQDTISVLFG